MGNIQTLAELFGLLIRRRLLIGAVTVFGIVLTLLYVISKPDVFESTAVIQVQGATVTSTDTGSVAGQESSAQRLQAIQQQLTTRENMLAVIARHQLYAGQPLTDDDKVHLLRMALRFEPVASAGANTFGASSAVSALLISAQASTPAKAARIANDFAQGILDAGSAAQIERTREASGFYREEEARLRTEITELGTTIAAYQNANRDALPAQRDQKRIELTALDAELRVLDQALLAAQNERRGIEAKSSLRATDRRQLDALSVEIETLTAQRAALEGTRGDILGALAKSPDVDRTLAEYDRQLTRLQSQLDVVTRRAAEAETARKLQDRQQGESFTFLERAVEPDYAISGGRRKLAAVGAMGSVFLAVLLAFVMDQLYPVLRTRSQLERELDLRPIVSIPEIRRPGKSLRQALLPDMPALSDLSRNVTDQLSGRATAQGNMATLTRMQSILAGGAIVLLVAVASALT